MTNRLILFIPLLPLLTGVQSAESQQKPYRPVVGQPHVNFTLPKISDRKPLSLSDYRGKKVLLLHFASW